jgi:hypothetical protein
MLSIKVLPYFHVFSQFVFIILISSMILLKLESKIKSTFFQFSKIFVTWFKGEFLIFLGNYVHYRDIEWNVL